MSDTLRYSETIAVFAPAFVALQAVLPKIPKDKDGQAGNQKTKYADLETTIELVKPLLAQHGFSFLQPCSGGTGGFVSVTTILLHTSGEWMRDTLSMPVGNNGAQSVGSAISYGKRYALTSLLGLATEDDDGHEASKGARSPRTSKAGQTPPPPPDDDRPPKTGTAPESQIKALQIEFQKAGITDRAERLRIATDALGHPVTSFNDLNRPEVARVFDALETWRKTA